jgi:hypothetical protein
MHPDRSPELRKPETATLIGWTLPTSQGSQRGGKVTSENFRPSTVLNNYSIRVGFKNSKQMLRHRS